MGIHFFTENICFKLARPLQIKRWVKTVALQENCKVGELNFIFCDDAYLHKINLQYLNHDDYTDIITFDNSDKPQYIEGDIFISIERVKENAQSMGVSFERELHRVMIHGVLHLLGYKDKTYEEVVRMRRREDEALEILL